MKALIEALSEAESLIGSPLTVMALDEVAPERRREWLRKIRILLKRHGVRPENLSGIWHT